MQSFVIPSAQASLGSPLGGKARALLSLTLAGFAVPEWAVIVPEAWGCWKADPVAVGQQILGDLLEAMPDVTFFAVRSSASVEDGVEHSFAGQLESFLFVPREKLLEKIHMVWESGFSDRVFAYCRERGVLPPTQPPSVLVQRMIDADSAGVAFGVDPVSGQSGVAVISAVLGLGTALVGGEADADMFRVDRLGVIIEEAIADKHTAHRLDAANANGVCLSAVPPEERHRPCLNVNEIQQVAALVREAGTHFGRPQDIEWAVRDGRLYLLQARPITALNRLPDPDGLLMLWDNSNIAESYNGVTTPLTFSFARGVYEEVYRQFCKLMGVSSPKIADHHATFARMLGLVNGRVYYNLLSWYRALALLPGFQTNRGFMEQMMGLKEPLPERMMREFTSTSEPLDRWRDRLDLGRMFLGLFWRLTSLRGAIRSFYERLDRALEEPSIPLNQQRADELAAHYTDLERQLLTRWDAPLVNDFFAMVFYGVLRKLCEAWCADSDGALQNDLISAEGGIISAEPARRMREMGALAAKDSEFVRVLRDGAYQEIQAAMERQPVFRKLYSAYLEKFGDRCLEELKLETTTLHDDPLLLLRSVATIASRVPEQTVQPGAVDREFRAKAAARVREFLGRKPFKHWVFDWVLRHARERVQARENLRFERTRLFGRVRRIFLEIGKRFYAANLLTEPRDIFYLTVEEIRGFIDGTTVTTNLAALVAVRKAEFESYKTSQAPADRFETYGAVHVANRFRSSRASVPSFDGEEAKGVACCPGIVKGRVRVILDPRNAKILPGEILVAPRTDPGWIMLFPAASGLLVEFGSLLSHSAIVARELGLPAVVSVTGLTSWLKTGDLVQFDGSTGRIQKLEGAS